MKQTSRDSNETIIKIRGKWLLCLLRWYKIYLKKKFKIRPLYRIIPSSESCKRFYSTVIAPFSPVIFLKQYRVLLNRLNAHLERDLLPESPSGFRAGRGTADMIFAARQLQEKCREQNVGQRRQVAGKACKELKKRIKRKGVRLSLHLVRTMWVSFNIECRPRPN